MTHIPYEDTNLFFELYKKYLEELIELYQSVYMNVPDKILDVKVIAPLLKGYLSDFINTKDKELLNAFKDEKNNYLTSLQELNGKSHEARTKIKNLLDKSEEFLHLKFTNEELMKPIVVKYSSAIRSFINQFLKVADNFNQSFLGKQFQLLDEITENITSIRNINIESINAWYDTVIQNLNTGIAVVRKSQDVINNLKKQLSSTNVILEKSINNSSEETEEVEETVNES